ncbi:MAG TPA: protease complex subunit PrcB family protein [Polyangia bacterium]|nr:protease complex subunit PrcB family protein [Polyangia bacterium]
MSLLAGLTAAGCSGQDFDEVLGDVGDSTSSPAGAAIAFQEFNDDVGSRAATEARMLVKTQQGYLALFGHSAPADVDFSRQWVIFYAAGTRPTGGYDANVLSLTRAGDKLVAVTELVSPGAGCAVTQAFTSPYVLIKFAAQKGAGASFLKKNSTHDCDTPNPCAAVLCPVGSVCKVEDVVCVRAPCPPRAVCVPDPTVTHCGGIAGIPCPTGQTCVDDPSDSCDPNNGGADCGGICVGDPKVVRCGGIAGIPCPGAGTCVDDASDSCDPNNGGADCGGVCRCAPLPCPSGAKFDGSPSVCACIAPSPPPSPGVFCGGIAGIPCPGAGRCVDDPSDSCDPDHGGADCGGLCQCVQNVACVRGSVFDSSPKVCACVPQPMCGPVCDIFCQYGNVLDAKGCPTCACNPAPTPPTRCPRDKCPSPAPGAPNFTCADGVTIGGPACVLDARGACGWTIISCPTSPTR